MYLIAGLGNPEVNYYNTRHNVGFMVIDSIAEFLKIEEVQNEKLYVTAGAEYENSKVVLMQPLTYMNLSGKAVKEFSDRFEIPKENILIIYDDINLGLGTIRLRPNGSDGGHNGIKSVIYEFESEDIPRLRIGIRNDENPGEVNSDEASKDLIDFVLSDFTEQEFKILETVINTARDAALSFVKSGIKETMNNFNKNHLEE